MVDILQNTLENTFKLSKFKEHQKRICDLVFKGNDVLFTAPKGKGKSLCYQLPGVIRGITLVISLSANDQSSKLRSLGLSVANCQAWTKDREIDDIIKRYLSNDLSYIFVAPERLGTGLLTFLNSKKPDLIAIDLEYKNYSQIDYPLLRSRLPIGVPIIALADAITPQTQQVILEQLNIPKAEVFTIRFNDGNTAVPVTKMPEVTKKLKSIVHSVTKPIEGFLIGSYVEHVKYGKGKVEASEKGSMGNRQATVRFIDGSKRIILEKYLKQVEC
jgi:DNA topoisomerase-3